MVMLRKAVDIIEEHTGSYSPIGEACSCGVIVPFVAEHVVELLNEGGLLRDAWVPEDGDAKCKACGRPNPVWWAPHDVWNTVMDGPDGILCPSCFAEKAEALGIGTGGAWLFTPPSSSMSQ